MEPRLALSDALSMHDSRTTSFCTAAAWLAWFCWSVLRMICGSGLGCRNGWGLGGEPRLMFYYWIVKLGSEGGDAGQVEAASWQRIRAGVGSGPRRLDLRAENAGKAMDPAAARDWLLFTPPFLLRYG